MTPYEFESAWLQKSQDLAKWLTRTGELGRVLALVILYFICAGFTYHFWIQVYPEWTRLYLMTHRFWLTVSLVALSFFARWIKTPWYLAIAMCLAWAYNTRLLHITNLWWVYYPLYFVFSFLFLMWILKNPNLPKRIFSAFILVLGFVGAMYSAGRVGFDQNSAYLELFWIIHPEYTLLSLVYLALIGKKENSAWNLALAPTQISNPLPIPIESKLIRNDNRLQIEFWWLGFINLCEGIIFFSIAMGLAIIPLPQFKFLSALFQMFFFCVFISGAMNVTTGILRMFGIDVPPASRFVLLANSPLDVWRRGSSYVYQMMLNMIFLPMMRWTRSVFVTTAVCVVFIVCEMFLMHQFGVKTVYSYLFPEFAPSKAFAMTVLWPAFYFTLGWLILIVLFRFTFERLYRKWKPPGAPWIQILINYLLVSILMFFILK